MPVLPVVRDRQVAPRPFRDALGHGERDGRGDDHADDRARARGRGESEGCAMCPSDKTRFEAVKEMVDGDETAALAALGTLRAFERGELSESEFRRRFQAYTSQDLPNWWSE